MRLAKIITFILWAVVVLCGSTANADLMNGGFETGNLADWYSQGAVQAVEWEYSRDSWLMGLQEPLDGYWDPTEGDYFASLWSQEEDFFPHTDSILRQTFVTPDPGYLVEFDYFYDFGDVAGYWAPAIISVMDGVGNHIWDLSINDPVVPTDLGDDENIDWTTASVLLPTAGTYTLEFHIADHPFGGFESILGVDDVSVVPLPSAFLLGSIGLGYASWRLRKQKVAKPQ